MAASMLSARRGWLQQLLDQYSGQSRLVAARCCKQQLAAPVEDEQRERAMQNTAAVVAQSLAQMTDLAVRLVHQNQRLRIGHNRDFD